MGLGRVREECDGAIIDPAANSGSLAARGSTVTVQASTVTAAMSNITATIGTVSGRGRSRTVRVGSLVVAIATLSARVSARRGNSRPGGGFLGLKAACCLAIGSAIGSAAPLWSRNRNCSAGGHAAAVDLGVSESVAVRRGSAQAIDSGNAALSGWHGDREGGGVVASAEFGCRPSSARFETFISTPLRRRT